MFFEQNSRSPSPDNPSDNLFDYTGTLTINPSHAISIDIEVPDDLVQQDPSDCEFYDLSQGHGNNEFFKHVRKIDPETRKVTEETCTPTSSFTQQDIEAGVIHRGQPCPDCTVPDYTVTVEEGAVTTQDLSYTSSSAKGAGP